MNKSIISLLIMGALFSLAAIGKNMSKYIVNLSEHTFSLETWTPPDKLFQNHREYIDINDESLYSDPKNGVTMLELIWTFREGFFNVEKGIMDIGVYLEKANKFPLKNSQMLKSELLYSFQKRLTPIGYEGEQVSFKELTINGRSWLLYIVPIQNTTEYTTILNENRYIRIRFSMLDSSKEINPQWLEKALELQSKLVSSVLVVDDNQIRTAR